MRDIDHASVTEHVIGSQARDEQKRDTTDNVHGPSCALLSKRRNRSKSRETINVHLNDSMYKPWSMHLALCTRVTASNDYVRYVENYAMWNYVIQNKFSVKRIRVRWGI